jgi:hypothetical protein
MILLQTMAATAVGVAPLVYFAVAKKSVTMSTVIAAAAAYFVGTFLKAVLRFFSALAFSIVCIAVTIML